MGLSDDLKMLAKSAFADIADSYQEILLQDSPLSVKPGPEWVPDTSMTTTSQAHDPEPEQGLEQNQGLSGEVLSPSGEPSENMPGYAQMNTTIDGEYRNLDDALSLPPPALQTLPEADGPLLLSSSCEMER